MDSGSGCIILYTGITANNQNRTDSNPKPQRHPRSGLFTIGEMRNGMVAPPKLELATTMPTTLPLCFLNHLDTIMTLGPKPDITKPTAIKI